MIKFKSNIESVCAICCSKQLVIKNKHFFSYSKCKICNHEFMRIKEDQYNKLIKNIILKNNIKQNFEPNMENVLEYTYCPYWTIMKYIHKIKSIKIKKDKNIQSIHVFSRESVESLSKNIVIPNNITEETDFYIISF